MSNEIIELERVYRKRKYLGKIIIRKSVLTPEFIALIKADKDDEMGYNKYKKKLKKQGYDVE